MYITSQIFGICAFVISLMGYHRKNKRKILVSMVTANILNFIHYLLLGGFSGCITKVLAIFRDCFIIKKEKNDKLSKNLYLFIFVILYIGASFFTYNGILSMFPLLGALVYTIVIWNGNEIQIRKIAFFCYFIWLIYNIFVFSIIGIISNIISIVSAFVAIINSKVE